MLFMLFFWQLATTYKLFIFAQLPSPGEVLAEARRYVPTRTFCLHLLATNARVLFGFLLACMVGIPFGLALGHRRVFNELTFPVFEVLRPIPPIAWLPLSAVVFSAIEGSVLFLVFISAFFPIAMNTYQGVMAIPAKYRLAALSLGASSQDIFLRVIVPGATPSIFTGLAVGMGLAWEMTVAAEMATGEHGIGYMTWDAFMLLAYPRIVLGMISLGLCGGLYSAALRVLGGKIMRWRQMV